MMMCVVEFAIYVGDDDAWDMSVVQCRAAERRVNEG